MSLKRTCATRSDRAHGETAACGLKTRSGTMGEVSWKSVSAKNERNYEKLEKTSDRVESDEEDATA